MKNQKFSDSIDDWMIDAISDPDVSPKEIYERIIQSVKEQYYYFKENAGRSYEILSLLNNNGEHLLSNVMKENEYYEGWDNDCMTPWGHSDLECASKNQSKKWVLPVEVDELSGECYVNFPDDLLEKADLKEGDVVQWIDRKDGSFELRKQTELLTSEDC